MSIDKIVYNIVNQDNRITKNPLFVVERQVLDYGYSHDYSDYYHWIDSMEGDVVSCDLEIQKLEKLEAKYESTGDYYKYYYKKRWEFVTACFTEKGCEEYLNINGHNLGKTRIYVYGTHRNNEYHEIRNMLIERYHESNAK